VTRPYTQESSVRGRRPSDGATRRRSGGMPGPAATYIQIDENQLAYLKRPGAGARSPAAARTPRPSTRPTSGPSTGRCGDKTARMAGHDDMCSGNFALVGGPRADNDFVDDALFTS